MKAGGWYVYDRRNKIGLGRKDSGWNHNELDEERVRRQENGPAASSGLGTSGGNMTWLYASTRQLAGERWSGNTTSSTITRDVWRERALARPGGNALEAMTWHGMRCDDAGTLTSWPGNTTSSTMTRDVRRELILARPEVFMQEPDSTLNMVRSELIGPMVQDFNELSLKIFFFNCHLHW